MYIDQLRFLSKLINERQTADSLLMDNMEELLDKPKTTCHVYVYGFGTRTEQLLNYDPLQITVHARLLGHSVLRRSTAG